MSIEKEHFLSIIKQNFFLYLRFARHTAKVKNFPHVNEDPKESLLREFQNEIMGLKAFLSEACTGSCGEIRIGHTETHTHDSTDMKYSYQRMVVILMAVIHSTLENQ